MSRIRLAFALAMGFMADSSHALPPLAVDGPLTARHFARFPAYGTVQLSPDGRYLAVTARVDGQAALLFFGLPTKNLVYGMRFQNDVVAGDIDWVSNERVVVSLAVQEGDADVPAFTGGLLAINADGRGMRNLYTQSGHGVAFMEGAVPDVPGMALVRVLKRLEQTEAGKYYVQNFTPLSSIDAYTGKQREVAPAPVRTVDAYFTDDQGKAYMASGLGEDSYRLQSFWRPGDGAWQPVPIKAARLTPLKLSGDGKRAYFDAEYDGGRQCLLEWLLPASATTPAAPPREVLCSPQAFLGSVYFTADDRPYGYNGGEEKGVVLIDRKPIEAQALALLQEQFPGQLVFPVGATRRHDKLLYHVHSDRNSGEYYIFDAAKQDAAFFDAEQPWLDPDRMATVRRIRYTARDGLAIDGYLTLPPGKPDKKLPMVVMPHGGPIGVRDYWAWDADAQFLASRGYAVLQMNYRGSGNRGEAFEKLGYGEWGGKIINDITDGARWAVSQGIADDQRLCIYGTSYGGYAALMSAVREPDLYRCAIGNAGAYDVELLFNQSVISKHSSNKLFWQDSMGKTPEVRRQQSPISYLDSLKAAVMIVHGEDDIITPLSQAKALRSALDARKKPYEWLVKSKEGHGFFNEDNRVELYEKLAAFLEKHIGK